MLYSLRNTSFNINGQDIYINNATLESNSYIDGRYDEGDRHTFKFSNKSANLSTLSFSYYLTGEDPIKNYLDIDDSFITGNISNLVFKYGCLSSYNAKFSPNRPIEVNASLDIYDYFSGNFTPSVNKEIEVIPLNASDMTIDNLTSSSVTLGNFKEATFQYKADVSPVYYTETGLGKTNILPNRVYWGKKEIGMSLVTDNIELYLPVDGQDVSVSIEAKDSNAITKEIFVISGRANKKSISITEDSPIFQSIDIIQNRVGYQPVITGINPSIANQNDIVYIVGSNLRNVKSLFIDRDNIKKYSIVSDDLITFKIDPDLNSGIIRATSFESDAYSPSGLFINYPNMSISNLNPTVLRSGELMYINGSNFNRISSIDFNNVSSTGFSVINNSLIIAPIPGRTLNGNVSVTSTSRNKSATSSQKFYTPPIIDVFNPISGFPGVTMNVTGSNFESIQSVTINNLSTSYTIVNTGRITFPIPTGNTWGTIKITNTQNQVAESRFRFTPDVTITGTTPKSGIAYTPYTISGINFIDPLLYNLGNSTYKVSFNGVDTGFFISSNTKLTGLVPKGAKTGPVLIYKNDGSSTYQSSGNFIYIADPPIVEAVFPSGFFSGNSFDASIVGKNLVNLKKIYLSGDSDGLPSGKTIVVWDKTYSLNSIPADTNDLRTLNTSLSQDVFGLASNVDPVLSYPATLSGNSFLTGLAVQSGYWHLIMENDGGISEPFGPIPIHRQRKVSHLSTNTYTQSSYLAPSLPSVGGASWALDGNTGTCIVTSPNLTNGKFKIAFANRCQIHRIEVTSFDQAYTDVGPNPRSLQINLGTGSSSVFYSGNVQLPTYSSYSTGYPLNTGTSSWRQEADYVEFHSKYSVGGVDQNIAIVLSEVTIYGIPLNY